MSSTIIHEGSGLSIVTTDRNPGYNRPQIMGRKLWFPMFVMALAAFPIGVALSWVRANQIASHGAETDAALALMHLVPAFMFIGFMSVLAAISFAVARILGAFRHGAGSVQETLGAPVQTLRMPATTRVFMGLMMIGMLVILVGVILHLATATSVSTSSALAIEQAAERLEGIRRLGVALYLLGIAFGLGTIIEVLRFQAIRIRELASN